MISEFLLAGAAAYGYNRLKNKDVYKIKSDFMKVVYRTESLINRQTEIPKIKEINRKSYGFEFVISLPWGVTFEEFEKHITTFKEGLKLDSIQMEEAKGIVRLHCIKDYKFKKFNPIKLKPYEILIGDGLNKQIVVNLNKFPHVLIGGDTGTGKSRLLLVMLSNLIKHSNADIYLLQVRKNDLGVFQNCRQVKAHSKSLTDVRDSLQVLDQELQRREVLIDNTRGIYNIEDYNKNAACRLKYIYVVVEEFSFLNISKGDSKDERVLKAQCLKYVKSIVNVGRSSGVFLITSLQKPTSDSIPSDIKAQLTTRISLTIKDKPTSIVVMGDDSATDLRERELICRTLNTEKGYTYTIEHKDVELNIKDSIIEKRPVVAPKPIIDENSIEDILGKLNEITG